MARIVAQEDVIAGRKVRDVKGGQAYRTEFHCPPSGDKSNPHAFLAERTPNSSIRPHYHDVDQFQVFVGGGGHFGKHPVSVPTVHFARAHTPYGPIAGDDRGIQFLTLRPIRAGGLWPMPDKMDELKSVPNRKPFQMSEVPKFEANGAVAVHSFSDIKDDQGLAAFSLRAGARCEDFRAGSVEKQGQYLIILRGSLNYEGKEHKAITIIWVASNEKPFQLEAGAEGLEALALNFPREVAAVQPQKISAPGYRVWQCALCAFTYDEAKGMPEEGIAAGTRWEDVPDSWICPDCAASKSDFDMAVVA